MPVISGLRRAGIALAAVLAFGSVPARAQTTLQPLDTAADPVVATVDGSPIRRSEVMQFQRSLPAQVQQQLSPDVLYPMLIDRLIDSKVLYEAGAKAKLDDDREVKQRVQQFEERVVQEVYLRRYVAKQVTDAALRKRYEQFVKDNPARDEVKARHILVQTETEARDIIADLKKGADFAELARAKSLDPAGKEQGGDLGFFTRDEMVPEFSDAAFKLKDGEVTPTPVKTQFGWHVIKVEAHRKASPSFAAVRDKLSQDMSQEVMRDLLANLRKDAKIERFNLDGSPIKADSPDQPAK